MPFAILFENEEVIAIDKPSGILVHRTRISEDTTAVLQELRDQIDQYLYPLHRLDRGTSGVLLFAKTQAAASSIGAQFRNNEVKKRYLAVIRGFVEPEACIDYALSNEKGNARQPAQTDYDRLDQCELAIPIGRYSTARYSYIAASPQTGRFHQIRRHFSHIRHPIIGDKKHGDVNHNRYFREVWGINRLLLHAAEIGFTLPDGNTCSLACLPGPDFQKALECLGLKKPHS